METLGELREAIKLKGVVLKIGQLSFEYEGGAKDDVDIKLEDDLIAYISNESPDEMNLADIELTVMGDIKRGKEALRTVKDAEKKLEEARKEKQEATVAIGKVEAYEKLLIGRDITISK